MISRLFWLSDILNNIIRANHWQGFIVPTKKRVIEFSLFGLKLATFDGTFAAKSWAVESYYADINAVINKITGVSLSDWHRLIWIFVIKLSIRPKSTQNYKSPAKIDCRNTQSRVIMIFYQNTCEIRDTHGLLPLFVFEVKTYYMQSTVFHSHWIF